ARCWDGAHGALFFPLSSAFIVDKEERPIFLQWAAERSTKNVPDEFVGDVRFSTTHLSSFNEPVVGTGHRGSVVFVEGAVPVGCADLRHQVDLSARSISLSGVVVRSGDAKFLHRVQRRRQYRCKCVSARLIIDVDAAEGNVALVAAGTVYRAVTGVLV